MHGSGSSSSFCRHKLDEEGFEIISWAGAVDAGEAFELVDKDLIKFVFEFLHGVFDGLGLRLLACVIVLLHDDIEAGFDVVQWVCHTINEVLWVSGCSVGSTIGVVSWSIDFGLDLLDGRPLTVLEFQCWANDGSVDDFFVKGFVVVLLMDGNGKELD